MTRAWGLTTPILITVLVALATPLIAAPSADADVTSCATQGGVGPVTPGAQSILTDLGSNPTAWIGDTDNGVTYANPGWEDGVYEYHDQTSQCLTVDTNGPADDGAIDTGIYSAAVDSTGAYDNTVCGTMLWKDRGPGDFTTVDLSPIQALGPGEDIVDATYEITFAAGAGPMQIIASSATGETQTGDGIAQIIPRVGNCIDRDVTGFALTAAFTVVSQPTALTAP